MRPFGQVFKGAIAPKIDLWLVCYSGAAASITSDMRQTALEGPTQDQKRPRTFAFSTSNFKFLAKSSINPYINQQHFH
jgi:hypothetical protein